MGRIWSRASLARLGVGLRSMRAAHGLAGAAVPWPARTTGDEGGGLAECTTRRRERRQTHFGGPHLRACLEAAAHRSTLPTMVKDFSWL
jgi:hypothetical protein